MLGMEAHMGITILILTAIGVAAAIINAVPALGIDVRIFGRPNMPLEGIPTFRTRQAWIALAIAVISLAVSGGAFYYFFRPRITEKIVDKTLPCPVQKSPEVTPIPGAKPLKGSDHIGTNPVTLPKAKVSSLPPTNGLQQSNSGGINIQQGTTGENSPIINSPITVGEVPKRISPADLATITQYLANAKSTTRIRIMVAQNSNAELFADDVYKAFKDAGWKMADEGVSDVMAFSAPGKKFKGVQISCRGTPLGDNERTDVHGGEPLYYIAQVLDGLKLPRILIRNQNNEADLISLLFTGMPD
jgi:hypothetical protein